MGFIGVDLIYPLLAIFQIFKFLNRLKLINISWGVLLESFQAEISNLFALPESSTLGQKEALYKYRFKLDE